MIHLMLEKESGRVLSAGVFARMPEEATAVDSLPEGDITQYCYRNGEFVYEPLPREDAPITDRERIDTLEMENKYLKEALELLLSGEVEEDD